jgi:hypothetical protein
MRTFLKYLCTFILCLAVIEIILFFAISYKAEWLKAKRLVYIDFDQYIGKITESDVKYFREERFSIYDKEIGWIPKPDSAGKDRNTAGGEWSFSIDYRSARVNPINGGLEKISTYGDSFTFCSEVNDDQTWQYFLSKLTGTNVSNFGVPGYGPDQALLRLKHNRETGVDQAKIVVLATIGENLNRIMNLYRPFDSYESFNILGFKPMFGYRNGEWVLIQNPLRRLNTLEDIKQAYKRAKEDDYWYEVNLGRPKIGFPYLFLAGKMTYYLFSERLGDAYRLYENPEALRKMAFIFDQFTRLAKKHDFYPIILFIPQTRDVRTFLKDGSWRYTEFAAATKERYLNQRVGVIDILDHPFDVKRFHVSSQGHASAYGNEVISGILHRHIGEQGLLEK